jgi:hypothetical protein
MRTLPEALTATAAGEVKLDGKTLHIDDDNVRIQLDLRFPKHYGHEAVRDWMQVYNQAAANLGFDEFEAVAFLVSELSTKDKEELLILLGHED